MRFNIPALPPIQLQSIFQLILTLAASLLTLRFSAGIVAWKTANNLEKPNYTVVKSLPASPPTYRGRRNVVEVRKYEPYLIAETTVDESSMRKAGGAGFGKCAGYIFGKNRPRTKGGGEGEKMAMTAPVRSVGDVAGEKMAMTAPVRSSGKMSGKKTKVSFVIGSKYDLKSAPKPIDESVRVRTVKEHYLAATSFSGPPPSDERIVEEREAIVRTLREEGIRVKDGEETMVYGYHDPVITPDFLRRNEVAVMVDGSSLN
mmetsp:Transcript_29885/g.62438  ORF Transcript_29885/g.62438 Transcript_29885/m.62438 type:complete len:259 (-) Transcript_29885:554-1330(-)